MATNLISNPIGNTPKGRQLKVPSSFALLIILIASLIMGIWTWKVEKMFEPETADIVEINFPEEIEEEISEPVAPPKKRFIPGNFSMDDVKKRGCVADGMLSKHGGKNRQLIEMIERSNCLYLHRALETWLDEPEFEKVADIMAEVDKPGVIFGMFLAEAVDKKSDYIIPETGEKLKFSEMCKSGTENDWGEHTCKPNIERKEYKKYLKSITEQAMNIGIQSFMFGQIHYQDWEEIAKSDMPGIIKEMRKYAKKINLQIIIGAQTNAITDEKYLKLFDYIEGGIGIDARGNIENGPCWSGKQSCWALLWHSQFSSKAKNVLLHLDWSGIQNDDMSKFARMNQDLRISTLSKLHSFFVAKDMGFLLPMQTPIWPDNPGCHGSGRKYYSADNRYTCKDEDAINQILLDD